MNRSNLIFTLVIGVPAVLAISMYVLNPFGTDTLDPRGRIFGHVPYRIPSASMEPTLMPGDLILVKTYVYVNSSPRRGDVIVFSYPPDPNIPFIMRIAGMPGDRLEIQNKKLLLNGVAVKESYAFWNESQFPLLENLSEIEVPDNHFFVMGDNRSNSRDSRIWGFLPRKNIIGRADYIWFSNQPSRTGRIQHGS